MSPRAAWRLEQLGFGEVYDYVPGKSDWLASDLPYEGAAILAGRAVNRDVSTCLLGENLRDVNERHPNSQALCIALNEAGVVMGVIQPEDLERTPETLVDDVMRFGTTTVRPSEDLEALLERMGSADVDTILVTRSDATLVGILTSHEAEHILEANP